MIAGTRSLVAVCRRVSPMLLLAAGLGGCGENGAGPAPEPEPLDLAVRVVVDSAEFRSGGTFALDLVPADRSGTSFVGDEWTVSTTLATPQSIVLTTVSQETQPPDTQSVASAILIDDSGSMRFSDPDRQRASAAQLFWSDILAARPASVVALLDFGRGNSTPTPGLESTVLLAGFTSDPAVLEAALDDVQAVPGGGTPMYASAREVIAWMDTATSDGYNRTLLVITDGEPGDSELKDSLVASATDQQVRVFAVGVGAAAEPGTPAETLLRELASRTGGIYGAAASPEDLEPILHTLAKSASPGRLLVHLRIDPAPAPGTLIGGSVTVSGERGRATAEWSFVAP